MNEDQAIQLLKKYSKDEDSFKIVLNHSKAVQKVALKIAKEILENSYYVDLDLIKTASLLHDIGRLITEKKDMIQHGVNGAEILIKEKLPEEALVAARHIGAGITKQDIEEQKLNLPKKDYMPETIEEKIITHADNLIAKDKEIKPEKAIERLRKEVNDKIGKRAKDLYEEIEELRS